MSDFVEKQVADYEAKHGKLPAHNKSVLRDMYRKEEQFWDRYEGLEEEGHSHSAVGDLFNAKQQ